MLNKLFENRYVQQLAINDHCREVLTIWDAVVVAKNSEKNLKVAVLTEHYYNELADLYLILGEYLADVLIEARRQKFLEKEKGE